MFVRTTRVRRGDKIYTYPQLVESYRRADGRPTHKVIASLKDWSPEAIEGLKVALAAARDGKALVAVERVPEAMADKHAIIANLDYLPLAVGAAIWARWGLSCLLDDLLPAATIASHSQVLQALVLHRCVAPDSKLAACAWYPNTALPELLGVKARHLNNSRVHRALDALSAVEETLQDRLAEQLAAAPGGVVATFLDLTDTWFVGRGPPMSRRGMTKEGFYREKVGIALLCDQRGFPLRWKTCQGSRYEPPVMLELLRDASAAGVLRGAPVVMDRAMGRGVHVDALNEAGITFLTALTRAEFKSFVAEGPWDQLGDVEVYGSPNTRKRELTRLRRLAHEAGWTKASNGRFVVDLGVDRVERPQSARAPRLGGGAIEELMREVRFMEQALSSGWVPTLRALARWYRCKPENLRRVRHLRYLEPPLQERLLRGEAEHLTLDELVAIADRPTSEQAEAFEGLVGRAAKEDRKPTVVRMILDLCRRSMLVRRVVCFSPQELLNRRENLREALEALHTKVEQLNREQRERDRPRSEVQLLSAIRRILEEQHWLRAFEVSTKRRRGPGCSWHELVLTRDEEEWRRRRRLDGFSVLVAHPDLHQSAEELVRLYFAKDMVEKDFQLIKSELDLRPVRHRTDPKVRAHVSLCMLALLLQRSVEQALDAGGQRSTAAAATRILETCHLNRVKPEGAAPYYTVTAPTVQQRELLVALGMEHLVDDEALEAVLQPR